MASAPASLSAVPLPAMRPPLCQLGRGHPTGTLPSCYDQELSTHQPAFPWRKGSSDDTWCPTGRNCTYCEMLLRFVVFIQVDSSPVIFFHCITGEQFSGRKKVSSLMQKPQALPPHRCVQEGMGAARIPRVTAPATPTSGLGAQVQRRPEGNVSYDVEAAADTGGCSPRANSRLFNFLKIDPI